METTNTVGATLDQLNQLETMLTDRNRLDQLSPELAKAITKVLQAKAALVNLNDRLKTDIAKSEGQAGQGSQANQANQQKGKV